MILKELKKYKKYILNFILAFITFLAILIYFKIIFSNTSYNFLLLVLFLIIFIFYNKFLDKYKKLDKRIKRYSLILALILSIILTLGSITSSYVYEKVGFIFDIHNIIYLIIGVTGFTILFKVFFGLLFKHLPNITEKNEVKMKKKTFILITILFLICFSYYYLRYFPAVMTPDSYYVIYYADRLELNDFHAFGHTLFFGIFYHLGMLLFNNTNLAIAFYTFIQMIICALIFTYVLKFLYERKVKLIFLIIIFMLFAFSPLFAIYSVTLWRDILFSMAFVTLFIALYKFIESDYKLAKSTIITYILSVLVILFFRNNGIYIVLLFIPFFIWLAKKNRKIVIIINLIIVLFYFVIKGPVFSYLNVQKTTSVEAFSVPLQQIARVIVSEGDIDKESYDYLETLMDIDKIKEEYNPAISDAVKRSTNNEVLSQDKLKFFKTWLTIGINNPRNYIDSYLIGSLGYWYPDVIYWATGGESESMFKEIDAYSNPVIKENVLDQLISRKIPLSNVFWSIGLMVIVLIISSFILLYKKQGKYLLSFIPLYALWLSLMLSSPVFAELRYIYALFACMPLIICTSLRTKCQNKF